MVRSLSITLAMLPVLTGLACPGWAASGPFLPATRAGNAGIALGVSPSGPVAAIPAPRVAPAEAALHPGLACRAAIAQAERAAGIPAQLMAAIGRVESGRYDRASNRTHPWPWTINAAGEPGVFEDKASAIAAVRARQAAGVQSIDVGCMQVNLLHHPNAFVSLEQAFDPLANATYAARFLQELHGQSGDWTIATARYHSATPERGAAYQQKIAAAWAEEKSQPPPSFTPPPGEIAALRGPGFLPPSRPDHARIIPLAALGGGLTNGATPPGRGLDAYRSNPIAAASRPRG